MKLDALRKKMKEKRFDAIIVLDELNQRYLSDFAFTDGCLFITRSEAFLITDFRYYEMALKHASKEFTVVMPDDRAHFMNTRIDADKGRIVGFEGNSISYAQYIKYQGIFYCFDFFDIGDMIEEMRMVKTAKELTMMQKAQDITDMAFNHILPVLSPNMTEIEVALELEFQMRKLGADGFAFETIAVSGDASALPHGTPRNVKLKSGFLTMDFGAKLGGYCSDMTRTVVIGKADKEMKKLYNTVLSAQQAAIDYLRAGVDCGEADKVARDIIDAEYKGAFGHSLGHGVGLFIHESPRLSARSFDTRLRRGNVVTVEPGIYLFGKYGCRIEDMVAIEREGVRNFTHSTKELIEIY